MRIIGLDIHRAFAEAVAWDDGKLKRLGRIDMRRHLLEAFAKKLTKEDVVVVEATVAISCPARCSLRSSRLGRRRRPFGRRARSRCSRFS